MASQRLGGSNSSGYGATSSRFTSVSEDRPHSETFEGVSSQISQFIFKINKAGGELQNLRKKINTNDDNPRLRTKIHNIQQEVKTHAGEITDWLRRLHQTVDSSDRQQKLQVERLTTSFKSTVEKYHGIQKAVTDLLKTTSLQTGAQDFDEDQDTWSEEANLLEQQKRREQLQLQQQLVEDDLAVARDREDRIREIEGDILNVNEIFKELGAMVYEQGEVVDTIETNVTTAADNVEEGNVQLQQAEKYQKKYRKKLCILAIIILIVAAVLALILGLTLKKK